MKTLSPDQFALSRPDSPQALLRLFCAGGGKIPEALRYLRRPHYRTINGQTATLATDGRVFMWVLKRVPGFADYEIPPGGMGHLDVAAELNRPRFAAQTDCPAPAGSAQCSVLSARCDDVWLLQHPARVRRYDLARLQLLDTVKIGPGEKWMLNGYQTGWKTLSIAWRHGSLSGEGLIICAPPREVKAAAKRKTRSGTGSVPGAKAVTI